MDNREACVTNVKVVRTRVTIETTEQYAWRYNEDSVPDIRDRDRKILDIDIPGDKVADAIRAILDLAQD